jgi:hypothetical protein
MLASKWSEDRSSAEAVIRDLLRQISDTVSSPTDDHIEIEEGTVVESPVIAGRLTDVKQTETDPPSRAVPAGPHFNVAARSAANVAKPKAG